MKVWHQGSAVMPNISSQSQEAMVHSPLPASPCCKARPHRAARVVFFSQTGSTFLTALSALRWCGDQETAETYHLETAYWKRNHGLESEIPISHKTATRQSAALCGLWTRERLLSLWSLSAAKHTEPFHSPHRPCVGHPFRSLSRAPPSSPPLLSSGFDDFVSSWTSFLHHYTTVTLPFHFLFDSPDQRTLPLFRLRATSIQLEPKTGIAGLR